MSATREVLGVLTVWLQVGLPFVVGLLAIRIARDYWQHLKEEHQQLTQLETTFKANTIWKPRY